MTYPFDERDTSSAQWADAVTKSDTATFAPCRALYVGTGGDVVGVMVGKLGTVTFKAVPSGSVLTARFVKVLLATTAADILALY